MKAKLFVIVVAVLVIFVVGLFRSRIIEATANTAWRL